MNDMNFNEVANANGFFDTPANEAIGSPENDGYVYIRSNSMVLLYSDRYV